MTKDRFAEQWGMVQAALDRKIKNDELKLLLNAEVRGLELVKGFENSKTFWKIGRHSVYVF